MEKLKAVVMVENVREIDDKTTIVRKYYTLDIDITAEQFAKITKNHWQIENRLNWILDVHFKEDLSTSKKDNSMLFLNIFFMRLPYINSMAIA